MGWAFELYFSKSAARNASSKADLPRVLKENRSMPPTATP